MSGNAASPSATAEKPLTRLPPYFPTTCKECATQSEAFFQCFEKYAVMMDDHDVMSARTSLSHCQPELRGYVTCMDNHIAKKGRPWWKFW